MYVGVLSKWAFIGASPYRSLEIIENDAVRSRSRDFLSAIYDSNQCLFQIFIFGVNEVCHISNNDFVLQKDEAPAYHSRHTVDYSRCNAPEVISPVNWPPKSPELNSVDFS